MEDITIHSIDRKVMLMKTYFYSIETIRSAENPIFICIEFFLRFFIHFHKSDHLEIPNFGNCFLNCHFLRLNPVNAVRLRASCKGFHLERCFTSESTQF